ncbi:Uncharacterised protein [Mycobacteroides abscessus subsp. abscessus]|nr:Uncharacterised protein [Mycobacteroides abscessus subsp. abscessus]
MAPVAAESRSEIWSGDVITESAIRAAAASTSCASVCCWGDSSVLNTSPLCALRLAIRQTVPHRRPAGHSATPSRRGGAPFPADVLRPSPPRRPTPRRPVGCNPRSPAGHMGTWAVSGAPSEVRRQYHDWMEDARNPFKEATWPSAVSSSSS